MPTNEERRAAETLHEIAAEFGVSFVLSHLAAELLDEGVLVWLKEWPTGGEG